MKIRIRVFLFAGLAAAVMAAFLLCAEARAVGVDATDVSGRSYGQAVLQEINGARQEIYVAMFAMYVRYGEVDNPAYELVDAGMMRHTWFSGKRARRCILLSGRLGCIRSCW